MITILVYVRLDVPITFLPPTSQMSWVAPPYDLVEKNLDASWSNGKAGQGCVTKDNYEVLCMLPWLNQEFFMYVPS